MNRKELKRIAVIVVSISLVSGSAYLLQLAGKSSVREAKLKKQAKTVEKIDKEVVEEVAKNQEETGKEKAMKMLNKLREDLGSELISGYLDTGEGGIKEPTVYTGDDSYLWSNVKGEYDGVGTVYLYGLNKSYKDESLTFFGHKMSHSDVRFRKVCLYNDYKDKLQDLTLYTEDGIGRYKISFVAKIPSVPYDKMITWTRDGIRDFFLEAPRRGVLIDSQREYKEDAKYVVLSTCATADSSELMVAVYEQIEFE